MPSKASDYIVKNNIIKSFEKMLDLGKRFECAKDSLLFEVKVLDPDIHTITGAII